MKVYLIEGKHCTEKQKTTVARRTLDPLYQQQLVFTEPYSGKILQVSAITDWLVSCFGLSGLFRQYFSLY